MTVAFHKSRAAMAAAVLLLTLTAIAYWPIVQNDFVLLDDPAYVLENPNVQVGLSVAGFKWAFTSLEASNWHPLTWLSHMADVQFFGDRAGLHHLVSLGWHATNALLLLLLLRQLTGSIWRSAIVAGLFALHPLHVESVAWVAERKDVLSTCFGLLALLAYAQYAQRTASTPSPLRKGPAYWFAVLFLALGLMSKPMLVTWPCLMLLLDFWPLNRWPAFPFGTLPELLREKLPMFALSLASCIVTYLAQQRGGATLAMDFVPLSSRLVNAVIAYGNYLRLAVWPADLAVFYPFHPSVAAGLAAVALLVAITWLAVRRRHAQPYLLAGWLWYFGTLVPVIGLVQVGMQAGADRYTYFPLTGIFIALVWGTHALIASRRNWTMTAGAVSVGLLATLAALTHRQVQYWRDTETLFARTLSVTHDNPLAELSLGCARLLTQDYAEARRHFLATLRLWPKHPDARLNLGLTFAAENRLAEAAECYRQVIELKPRFLKARLLAAETARKLGRYDEALTTYRQALEISSNDTWLLRDFASFLATCPKPEIRSGAEAVRLAEQACAQTRYREPFALSTLGLALAETGRFADAIKFTEQAQALAETSGMKNFAARQTELLELYRARQPSRETQD